MFYFPASCFKISRFFCVRLASALRFALLGFALFFMIFFLFCVFEAIVVLLLGNLASPSPNPSPQGRGKESGKASSFFYPPAAVLSRNKWSNKEQRDRGTKAQSRKIFKKISLSHLCSSSSFFVALCLCAFASLCLQIFFPVPLPFIESDAGGQCRIKRFDTSLHGDG